MARRATHDVITDVVLAPYEAIGEVVERAMAAYPPALGVWGEVRGAIEGPVNFEIEETVWRRWRF